MCPLAQSADHRWCRAYWLRRSLHASGSAAGLGHADAAAAHAAACPAAAHVAAAAAAACAAAAAAAAACPAAAPVSASAEGNDCDVRAARHSCEVCHAVANPAAVAAHPAAVYTTDVHTVAAHIVAADTVAAHTGAPPHDVAAPQNVAAIPLHDGHPLAGLPRGAEGAGAGLESASDCRTAADLPLGAASQVDPHLYLCCPLETAQQGRQ